MLRVERTEYDHVVFDLVGDDRAGRHRGAGYYLPGAPGGSSGFSTPGAPMTPRC